jgi:hypothetical protein
MNFPFALALPLPEPVPHAETCFVWIHARALIGYNRRGLCTCGAEQKNEIS